MDTLLFLKLWSGPTGLLLLHGPVYDKAIGHGAASTAMAMPVFHLDHTQCRVKTLVCEVARDLMIIIAHGGVPGDDTLSKFRLYVDVLEVLLLYLEVSVYICFFICNLKNGRGS